MNALNASPSAPASAPAPAPNPAFGGHSERWLIAVLGAVQFVNIVDFMMVMPLGPDFAQSLDISTSHLGIIGGAYTGAAAVSGLAGAFFLDRFERRSALVFCAVGLSLGTLAGAFAWDLNSLVAARVLAGLFGGPASSISLAIIADVIPPERRGRAMGAAMGAFSAASVLGVPAGLELARLGGWRLPFFVVAGCGLAVALMGRLLLPRLTLHLERGAPPPLGPAQLRSLTGNRDVLLAYGLVAVTNLSGFLLIPNLSAHVQLNLQYPRDQLGVLYLVGGALSFFVLRLSGRFVDRLGAARVVAVAVLGLALVLLGFIVVLVLVIPLVVYFALFMSFQASRNVAQQTLLSKVPPAPLRAGFMSFLSAVQHAAAALGAMSGSLFLTEAGGRLDGMDHIALVTIGLNAVSLPLVFWLEARVSARAAPQNATLLAAVAHVPPVPVVPVAPPPRP